ncbi:hypothetical protein RCO27_13620 [Sphingosinicella sp. LHD-64]|uniref:hypothetical protein n=1 Tax=Sphingosinicella sp. LHD-64 TaxID=3072139 RepID=UPI00280F3F1B|nr:hypothetical protein [Sphingosinicella sp. LHD-64]MDQ8757264.1 hypothetical protein [Sphingosinicella sp. LHD-64]
MLTGMSEDLIHVHIGLAIFVLVALVLRRRMRSPIPLAAVVALALINELVDYRAGTGWAPVTSAFDFVNTVFWPLLLFLLARRGKGPVTLR